MQTMLISLSLCIGACIVRVPLKLIAVGQEEFRQGTPGWYHFLSVLFFYMRLKTWASDLLREVLLSVRV